MVSVIYPATQCDSAPMQSAIEGTPVAQPQEAPPEEAPQQQHAPVENVQPEQRSSAQEQPVIQRNTEKKKLKNKKRKSIRNSVTFKKEVAQKSADIPPQLVNSPSYADLEQLLKNGGDPSEVSGVNLL